ncbi:hypothetical protein [Devosia sp. Root635]|uniref:hypothetical protein n=1 Tax=Devosia sp. Root635 TaxID=1736575 RepID=UPI0006F7E3F6|nr:hypothetical protein [Devosia sp. Root635]KRA40279.1 hypothetical protein ASD80_12805 [Devosia sp. Root635]
MHIKTIASAAVLTAALGFSGMAYAQTMIGNAEVSDADMERVKNYCVDLQTEANQAVGTSETDTSEPTEDSVTEEGGTTLGAVDIDQVTLETCLEAGFIEEPVVAPQ